MTMGASGDLRLWELKSLVKGLEGRTDATVLSNASTALALLHALEERADGHVSVSQPVTKQRAAPRAQRSAPRQPSSAPAGSAVGRAVSDGDKSKGESEDENEDSMRLVKTAGDRNARVRDFLRTGRPAEAPRSDDLLHEVGGVDDCVVSHISERNNSMRQFLIACRQGRGHDSGSRVSLRRKAAADGKKKNELATCIAGVLSASQNSAVQRVAHDLDFVGSERIQNRENDASPPVEHASLLRHDEATRISEVYFTDNSGQDPLPLLTYYAGDVLPQDSTKEESVLIARVNSAKKLSRSAPNPNRSAAREVTTKYYTGGSGEDLLPILTVNNADPADYPSPHNSSAPGPVRDELESIVCMAGSSGDDVVPLMTMWENNAHVDHDFAMSPSLKSSSRLTPLPTLQNTTAALRSCPLPPAPVLYNRAKTPLQSDLRQDSASCGITPHATPLLSAQFPPTPVDPAVQEGHAPDAGNEVFVAFEKMYDSFQRRRDQFLDLNRQAQVLASARPTRSAMLESHLPQAPTLIRHVGASVADYNGYEVVEYPAGGPLNGSSHMKPISHPDKHVTINPIGETIVKRTTPDPAAGIHLNGRLSSLDSDVGFSLGSYHDFNVEQESAEIPINDSRPEIDADALSLEKEIEDELRQKLEQTVGDEARRKKQHQDFIYSLTLVDIEQAVDTGDALAC